MRRGLSAVVGLVLLIHLYIGVTDSANLFGESLWRRLANLDSETSFPTWLTSMLLLMSAVLCWLESRLDTTNMRKRWRLLAVGFVVLSIDEVAALHEMTAGPLRRLLDVGGPFFYAWVIPALAIVVVAAAYFYPILPPLPRSTRFRILLAGGLYVMGAVGMEMVSGVLTDDGQRDSWTFYATATVEEIMEIGGVFLFVDTLILRLAERTSFLRIAFNRG